MSIPKNGSQRPAALTTDAVDVVIRFGLLALLGYWSWGVIAPFLTIGLWSAILAVALYPLFDRLSQWLRRRWLAAALVTLLCLLIVVAPVTWLGLGMISGIKFMAKELDAGLPSMALPNEAVRGWPIIGESIFQLWSQVVTDVKVQFIELVPYLKPVGTKLFEIAANTMLGLVKCLVAIVVAGFLFCPGPNMVDGVVRVMERVLRPRGSEMVRLAGATIRNVSRGVIGIALLQSLLGGAGFLAAGVPAAGILAFASLLLGILQIGPAIVFLPVVIWSWTAMDPAHALLFTAYMIPVGLLDNFLKPILIARGLSTPTPVILVGVIGGTVTHGIIGLFLGPIVLSVAWELVTAWLAEGDPRAAGLDERVVDPFSRDRPPSSE
jgi:predicted PurR-regulated permease PerM